MQGTRATGVVVAQGGETRTFGANREVIVSAGALNSPKVLHLSGIGPANHLRSLGIDVHVDSPDVGRNMSEHLLTWQQYWLKDWRHCANRSFALATTSFSDTRKNGFVRRSSRSVLGSVDGGAASGNNHVHLALHQRCR